MLKIFPVETGENLEQVRMLWREFAEFLKEKLAEYSEHPFFIKYFEDDEHEITHLLPGSYGRPTGCLLLAEHQGKAAGCIGIRDLDGGICEMRRLFIRPRYRRLGIGKALCEGGIEWGTKVGYTHMRLCTVVDAAKALYKSLGFKKISPYEDVPINNVVFMELKLT